MSQNKLESARDTISKIDKEMALLFEERMKAVALVAEYKKEAGLPIYDPVREEELLIRGQERISDQSIKGYYTNFQRSVMDVSKAYQKRLVEGMRVSFAGTSGAFAQIAAQKIFPDAQTVGYPDFEAAYRAVEKGESDVAVLSVKTEKGSYPVIISSGILKKAGENFDLNRKCLILTDENIPTEYIETLKGQTQEPFVYTIAPGEESKTLPVLEKIISFMLAKGFDRKCALVALGGGVVGDLGGFVASVFQRGIDFYNIPTTVLSQVDSSIGGKVAVNFEGYKNMVGAFYPPKGVLVDAELLKSLPQREISNGLAEAVKMAATFDQDLFSLFEKEDPFMHLETIIQRSLKLKKKVVEEDEKEMGLRKVLNFGHSLGHAIENMSIMEKNRFLHGECVALGMLSMCSKKVRERLLFVLEKLSLPTVNPYPFDLLVSAMSHDKKISGNKISLVFVDEIGSFRMEDKEFLSFCKEMKERML